MKAVSKILAGGVAIAALASAAPAAAQYYPGYGYGGGNVVGQVLNQVLGGSQYGYGYGSGYGVNSQAAVQRCAAAVQQRIDREYGYGSGGYGYGGYGGYNNNGYAAGNARVLGVTSIDRRSNGGLRIRGVATANAYAGGYGGQYGGGYGGYGGYSAYGGYAPQASGELTFKCDVDYRGFIRDTDVNRNSYSNYGYRRY
jgi:hypothetical protein